MTSFGDGVLHLKQNPYSQNPFIFDCYGSEEAIKFCLEKKIDLKRPINHLEMLSLAIEYEIWKLLFNGQMQIISPETVRKAEEIAMQVTALYAKANDLYFDFYPVVTFEGNVMYVQFNFS